MVSFGTSLFYLGDDASRSHGAAVPDGDAREDDDVACNPAVLAHGDFPTQFRAVGAIPEIRIQGMCAAEEGDVGPDQGPRTNAHETCVQYGAVEVDEDVAPNLEVGSIVDVDGPFDPGILVQDGIFFGVCLCWRGKFLVAVDYSFRQEEKMVSLEGTKWPPGPGTGGTCLLLPILRYLAAGEVASAVEAAYNLPAAPTSRDQLGCEGVVELTALHAGEVLGLVYFRNHEGCVFPPQRRSMDSS
ncbi:hypothetical protein GGR57DRAFT_293078 [Xylariaceae sp. FL1272]|nr:hypothetical protein GGR57DRAFT_293078 [Xylariaceae sp. FL1272]